MVAHLRAFSVVAINLNAKEEPSYRCDGLGSHHIYARISALFTLLSSISTWLEASYTIGMP